MGRVQAAQTTITIPIAIHVITDGVSVSQQRIDEQLDVLNAAFLNGQPVFTFVPVTPPILPIDSFEWGTSLAGSPEAAEMMRQTQVGFAPEVMHVYVTSVGDVGLYSGYATFPWEYAEDSDQHGVVVDQQTLPLGSNPAVYTGDILVHEVGHHLGLYHTWQGGCGDPGDEIEDTSPHLFNGDLASRTNCAFLSACGGTEPGDNHMNNTLDDCRELFTPGQHIRMGDMVAIFKPGLIMGAEVIRLAATVPPRNSVGLTYPWILDYDAPFAFQPLSSCPEPDSGNPETLAPCLVTVRGSESGVLQRRSEIASEDVDFGVVQTGPSKLMVFPSSAEGLPADIKAGEVVSVTVHRDVGTGSGNVFKGSTHRMIAPSCGGGSFPALTTLPEQSSQFVAAADFDSDGYPDLLRSGTIASSLEILWNDGSGGFDPIGVSVVDAGRAVGRFCTGDVDNDSDVDVIAVSEIEEELVILRNNGAGMLSLEPNDVIPVANIGWTAHGAGGAVEVVDVDNDGFLDLLVAGGDGGFEGGFLGVLRSNGGSFLGGVVERYTSIGGGFEIEGADLDNDGDMDIMLASTAGTLAYMNDGDGLFGAMDIPISPACGLDGFSCRVSSIQAADLDGDAVLEIVVSSTLDAGGQWVEVLGRLEDGAFVSKFLSFVGSPTNREGVGFRIAVGDIDGDGDRDLVTCQVGAQGVRWFENVSDPGVGVAFVFHETPAAIVDRGDILLSDVDRNGALDVITSGLYGPGITVSLASGVPDAPVLLEPAEGVVFVEPASPTLTCAADPIAVAYQFQIDINDAFSSPTTSFIGNPNPVWQVTTPLTAGIYYWRARVLADCGAGDWTLPRTLQVDHDEAGCRVECPEWSGPDGRPIVSSRIELSPNPFSERARISWAIQEDGDLEVAIYDIGGRRRMYRHFPDVSAGPWAWGWDGRGENGRQVPAGVYLVRVKTRSQQMTARMVRID